jgi:hypothetical protein
VPPVPIIIVVMPFTAVNLGHNRSAIKNPGHSDITMYFMPVNMKQEATEIVTMDTASHLGGIMCCLINTYNTYDNVDPDESHLQ